MHQIRSITEDEASHHFHVETSWAENKEDGSHIGGAGTVAGRVAVFPRMQAPFKWWVTVYIPFQKELHVVESTQKKDFVFG